MQDIDIYMNNIDFLIINKISPIYRAGNAIAPHRHGDIEIHLITSGHGFMEVEGERFPVKENCFIISFPGELHRLITADDCVFLSQYLAFCKVPNCEMLQFLRDNYRTGKICFDGNEMFAKAERMWNSGDRILKAAAEYSLTAFVLAHSSTVEQLSLDAYIEKAREYMRRHVAEKISLTDISRHVGLEKSYFSRLFKRKTGETPLRFFMFRKIELCKAMLNSGRLNSEVAQATGFADEFHFSRTFKKITGMSPRLYRKNISSDSIL